MYRIPLSLTPPLPSGDFFANADALALDMGVLIDDALALSLAGVKFWRILLAGVPRVAEWGRVLMGGQDGGG